MAPRNDSFFNKLTRIFRSGPAIQRRVKGIDYKNYFDNELIRGNYGYRAPFPFGREASPFSVGGTYGILDRLSRYCLAGDTLIATNSKEGYISIKELSEKFSGKTTEKFYTYSYDKESDSIVLRQILDAFCTKEDELVEIYFDNGATLRCTKDHRVMLRDGSYKEAQFLNENDTVMPFYRKTLLYRKSYRKYKNNKVVKVVFTGKKEKVYDLTIENTHNFAVLDPKTLQPCGIVHNSEFSEMEFMPECAAALNVLADECVAGDEKGKAFHLYSKNSEVKKSLEELFFDVLNIDFNLRPWIRNMAKYGDFFMYLEVIPDIGVVNVQPIPVNEIEREEGFDPEDPYAVRFKWLTRGNRYIENWQLSHFRILGNDLYLPYGSSILDPARRIFRQLCVRKSSKVHTINGPKKIEDLKAGDIVYCFDYEQQKTLTTKVKHCITMGKQSLVSVITNHRKIDVTPNHGLLVKNSKGEFLYKKAEELICSSGLGGQTYRNADKLVLPMINNENKSYSIDITPENYFVKLVEKYTYNSKNIIDNIRKLGLRTSIKNTHAFMKGKKKISYHDYCKLKTCLVNLDKVNVKYYQKKSCYESTLRDFSFEVSSDFMRLFGFMFGDGWSKKTITGFALGIYEDQNKYYIDLFEKLFNRKLHVSGKKNSNSKQANVSSKEIFEIFQKFGFKTGFLNKRIPSWVFSIPQKYKIEFLKGLFDADGYPKGQVLGLSNKRLLEDVQLLCMESGVPVSKKIYLDKPEGKYFDKSFNKLIDRKASYKLWLNLNAVSKENVIYEAVNYVIPLEKKDETYDLEVEHSSHNFMVNGIISHNTMMEDAMLVYRVARSADKRVFYIDVGNIAPNDVPSYMEAVKQTLKSNNIMDRTNGRMDQRYNPESILEDFYIPVRGSQTGTRIDTLAGGQNATATEDVEYLQKKLFAALQVPKPYLNFMESLSAKASLCVTGDTVVKLLNSTNIPIKDLSELEEYQSQIKEGKLWTYSSKLDGEIVPGKITYAGKTKDVTKLIRVAIDNGSVIECTHNHPFLLRDGTYAQASELKSGDSLMPLYTKRSSKSDGDLIDDYEMVWCNAENKWKYTHKVVNDHTAEINGGHLISKMRVVHHKDFNKHNNSPDNLQEMTWYGHRKLHSSPEHLEQTIFRPDVVKKREKVRIEKWLKSDRHRAMASVKATEELTTPGRPLYNWIHSKEHSEQTSRNMKKVWKRPDYREIKIQQNKDRWNDFEYKQAHSGKNHWSYSITKQFDLTWLIDFCIANPEIGYNHFKYPNKFGVSEILPVGVCIIKRIFRENNIKGWREFTKLYLNRKNHKVVSVEEIELVNSIPVYDLTVEDHHNFAIENGIFIHNSQIDIRFSRTIAILQRIVIAELNKLAMIHLYSKGFDGEDLIDFELKLSNPSTVAHQQKLEVLSTKFDIAGKAKDTALVDEDWIQRQVLDLSEDEIIKLEAGRRRDKIRSVELEAIAVKENLPQKNTTTDPFDASNYQIPGGTVKRNPQQQQDQNNLLPTVTNSSTPGTSIELANGGIDHDTEISNASNSSEKYPIKATPFLTAAKIDKKRRVGYSGRSALALPDFKAMMDAKRNRALTDVYDKETLNLKSPLTVSENIDNTDISEIKFYSMPYIPNEMQSIFKRLQNFIEQHENKTLSNKLLTEDNDSDDDDGNEIIDIDIKSDSKHQKKNSKKSRLISLLEEENTESGGLKEIKNDNVDDDEEIDLSGLD